MPNETIAFTLHGSSVGTATTNADGVATLTGVSLAGFNAGTYSNYLAASFAGDASYGSSNGAANLTVTKDSLTITANNQTMVYGGADPILSYTVSGTLYYGDTYSVISGVVLSTVTGSAATVGTHPITASGGTAVNYVISDVPGVLMVTQAALTAGALTPPGTPAVSTFVNSTLSGPSGLAFDAAGNLYVANYWQQHDLQGDARGGRLHLRQQRAQRTRGPGL